MSFGLLQDAREALDKRLRAAEAAAAAAEKRAEEESAFRVDVVQVRPLRLCSIVPLPFQKHRSQDVRPSNRVHDSPAAAPSQGHLVLTELIDSAFALFPGQTVTRSHWCAYRA